MTNIESKLWIYLAYKIIKKNARGHKMFYMAGAKPVLE